MTKTTASNRRVELIIIRDNAMNHARRLRQSMSRSTDQDHINLVYLPEIRRVVETARGANYAAMFYGRLARTLNA